MSRRIKVRGRESERNVEGEVSVFWLQTHSVTGREWFQSVISSIVVVGVAGCRNIGVTFTVTLQQRLRVGEELRCPQLASD